MNGKTEQKDGDNTPFPGIIETVYAAFRLIFFNERFVYNIFLNRRHMLNAVTVFCLFLLIPVESPFNEGAPLFHPGQYVETLMLTVIFISIVFVFVGRRVRSYLDFLRVMLLAEVVDVIGPISFFLDESWLPTFIAVQVAWYLAVTVFVTERLSRIGYTASTMVVMAAFFITMFVPALFA